MPRNKREGLVFGVAMAFTMSLFMNIFNAFRHSGIQLRRSDAPCCCSR